MIMPKWTDEQFAAIHEKGQNIIVSAGAGSGKTAVLSERVLEHVKSGIDIEDLLVLTFTNAAASEMKERIRRKLMDFPELKNQLDKVELAYITTFDAYAFGIVKKYNYLLNVSKNITIAPSGVIELKKREILNSIFEEKYASKDLLFLKLIGDFCLKDDKEIFESVLSMSSRLDNLYGKSDYLENYLENYYNDFNLDNFILEYTKLIKKKISNIEMAVDYLSSYVSGDYVNKIIELLSPMLMATNYVEIKNNVPEKLPPLPRGSSEEAKVIKSELSSLIKEISALTRYENEAEIKKTIWLTKDYVQAIIQLILEFDKRLMAWKMDNDVYEFIDIAKMAICVLEKNKTIREDLKNKYKEILIDEYQDTNDLQDLFISYIQNNNVYMVGDVKQSIYRFRNANPLLFKEKYDKYSDLNGGMKIDLNRNFRSRKEVTENINLIFNLIMNDEIGGADYISSHQMIFGNLAYDKVNSENYQMEILDYKIPDDKLFSKEEIEIFTIARDIENKVNSDYKIMDKNSSSERSITYGDFVILMDRSSAFENYKKIFEYLNIPLTIYQDKTISNSVDILLIKNIYNIVIGIKDRKFDTLFKYSFMSILRSYLFRLSDAEIFKIISQGLFKETALYEKCLKIAKDFERLNNKDFYNRIIDDFDFYNKVITIGDVNEHIITLNSIGKIASDLCNLGYGPRQFLDYLKEVSEKGLDIKLSLNKESSNSVKIMTIHASKGLEYHVCYFSGLYKKFNIDDLKNKFYFSSDYGILAPYIDGGPKNTILKSLLKSKYLHEEISEKLRLFYVALTRAREKIILVTQVEPNLLSFKSNGVINDEIRENYLSFADMLNSVCNYVTSYIKEVDVSKLGLTKDYNLARKRDFRKFLATDETLVVMDKPCDEIELVNTGFSKKIDNLYANEEKENIEFGLKLHRLLEFINFKNPDYEGIDEGLKTKIQRFIDSGILTGAINIYKEYEFIYEDSGKQLHGVIDLLIEYNDKFAIVDYKLKNMDDKAYENQLLGYKDYIQLISDKPVQVYLYYIMDEELLEL